MEGKKEILTGGNQIEGNQIDTILAELGINDDNTVRELIERKKF
ncbi:MAG: hypothetical protein UW14_C0007G0019 [Candidatus Yanofskybacteria bacterium GW2011_GWA2_44_10]|uniref:Uncharacterized protein n=1 Tax=Candidatus Yanofskybacteria bacterium GW2011_GWB1_45_11 TaxID=1619026 RepID=A0A0G1L1Z8_9BACT|nr:MAG: hypothetical protein UW14_C0007G0019 [Candidatus Yanofskybacteria bacterium GW2011_GWA2_44_10]KKT90031.1 MAG: hypothetical protein UW90_C0008G0020 [Candidatus Yanofskybacteria bacterium GW2011_GWB1_45_11]